MTCSASNAHITLSPYFQRESRFHSQHAFQNLKNRFKLSTIQLWKPLRSAFPNTSIPSLPDHLRGLKKVPIKSLINQLHKLNDLSVKDKPWAHWHLLSTGIGSFTGVAFILMLIVYCIKSKLQISAKRYMNKEGDAIKYEVIRKWVSAKAVSGNTQDRENTTPTPLILEEEMVKEGMVKHIYPTLQLAT
ncbi:hypothetical protein LOTGIDRAFT_163244 [Lottia gigantea]|uniref:Uncharacterized protein n=1 Tax=Lottia gigantea TaxID=225164 RepID=V4A5C8_LOTGI|nr:hypothetical protein LOTGIDRAFT_163244 [Lottia gigantea]ESO91882.1 hypothetical protein LOTGIDRAFT_163244 [Lottia gigantea]